MILMNNLERVIGVVVKNPFGKDEPREDDGKVQKRHQKFWKKESLRVSSPLAQSKGSTLVGMKGC